MLFLEEIVSVEKDFCSSVRLFDCDLLIEEIFTHSLKKRKCSAVDPG